MTSVLHNEVLSPFSVQTKAALSTEPIARPEMPGAKDFCHSSVELLHGKIQCPFGESFFFYFLYYVSIAS